MEHIPSSPPSYSLPPSHIGGMGDHGMGMGPSDRAFPCVKLRGLPFDVTEDDIRNFLGCDPVDILLVKRDGRLSGEAFIVLSTPIQVEIAVGKNKSYMGRRYIEVFVSKKMDYYKAVVAEMMEGGGGGMGHRGMGPPAMHAPPPYMDQPADGITVLRLRGLPFSTHADDIVRWFQDVAPVSPHNVHIVSEYGRATGVAFVEFASAQDAARGMAKDRQMMGSRYVEIFPSSPQEMSRFVTRY